MTDFLSSRPLQVLAEALLHFLWQGAALFVLLRLVSLLLRSAQQRHAAALVALCLMLLAPLATCYVTSQRAALPSVIPPIDFATEFFSPAAPDAAASGTHSFDLVRRAQLVCVGLWLLGVVVLATRLLAGYAGIVWLRGERRELPAQLAQRVAWLGRRLGVATRCRVFLSTRVDEAIAVGLLKPLVLVPLAWANELPTSVLEAVIAHELAHIRRWDLWITLLQRLTETLLFYHPAVWWVSRQVTFERELCCDELAVAATQRRTDYALALEMVARRMSAPPPSLATSFLGGGNMNLLKRVQNVLTGPAREATSWWPAGLAALAAPAIAALALSGWSPLAATADDDDPKAEDRKFEELEREVREELEDLIRQAEQKEAVETEVRSLKEQLAAKKKFAPKETDDDGDDDGAKKGESKDAPQKDTKKGKGDEFDFADFKPQTDREERLVAVIRKLQAQLKQSGGKKGSDADGEYKRAVEAKMKAAAAEKDAAIRKEQDAKRAYELDLKQQIEAKTKAALAEKEAAVRKAEEARRDYEIKNKQAIQAKLEAADKAALEKQEVTRKEKLPGKGGYEKEFRKGAVHKDGEAKKKTPDDVELLRRTLEEQQAQLRKMQDVLTKLQDGAQKESKRPGKNEKKAQPKDGENLRKE